MSIDDLNTIKKRAEQKYSSAIKLISNTNDPLTIGQFVNIMYLIGEILGYSEDKIKNDIDNAKREKNK